MQLRVATERLADRFGIATVSHKPTVGYRETIKKGIVQRGRHKKQSGGHGQYGDVVLDIKPLPRGSGFSFSEEIKGGVVPRNYIPSVEEGVIDALKHGPLGFPVVDVAAKLIDGSYHTVDSSDMAFSSPVGSRSTMDCRSASRYCSSRSTRSRSSVRRRQPPR
jgi:elongation factor G